MPAAGLTRLLGATSVRSLVQPLSSFGCLKNEQRRGIRLHSLLSYDPYHPEPWDYKRKGYTAKHTLIDGTLKRFNENTKLIMVEGNIGSGKSTLAKELADLLGMYHMPEFNLEDQLVDRYGNNLKDFYHLFPESYRIPTVKDFYNDPYHKAVGMMQWICFFCKFEQYSNALAHLLNTGQGVVLERSFHADFVFVNAMRAKRLLSHEFFRFYHIQRKSMCNMFNFWPHLVIYLDTPVDKCLERIKERGREEEVTDKHGILDRHYLSVIEASYRDLLAEYRKHSYVLVYDWEQATDADLMVADLEKVEIDMYERHTHNQITEDWNIVGTQWGWNYWRYLYTDKRDLFMYFWNDWENTPFHECEEMLTTTTDVDHWLAVMRKFVLQSRYTYGYNLDKGDSFWKGLINDRIYGPSSDNNWFEYHYFEHMYSITNSYSSLHDHAGEDYNPDYLHH